MGWRVVSFEQVLHEPKWLGWETAFDCPIRHFLLWTDGNPVAKQWSSAVWTSSWFDGLVSPLRSKIVDRMVLVDLDLCCFGLKIPNGLPIKKHTKLLVSHADIKTLAKTCPGNSNVGHCHHQVIAGSHPSVGSISKFAGRYRPGFIRAVMCTVREFPKHPVLVVNPHKEHECFAPAQVRELNEANGQRLQEALHKLHTNLGHPGNQNLKPRPKPGPYPEAWWCITRGCRSRSQFPAPAVLSHRSAETATAG